ncbi:MAG: DUF3179 domain-containing protein [Ardenticatenaceae bacterium]|nr:DUF3179 domain-containing protein [Ardenticatenaceae bacterium]
MKRTLLLILGLLLAACSGGETAVSPTPTHTSQPPTATAASAPTATNTLRKSETDYADLDIITLLPPEAIPAIDNPQFIPIDEADAAYDPDELVIGVALNGEARAYSVPLLSNHEIVNDVVGGQKIAVTW